MTICFIIDTNPSMKEITDSMSALDMCKCAVEQLLIKFKSMGMQNILDRSLMLIKTGVDSSCLLSTFGRTQSEFERELKNISYTTKEHSLSYSVSLALSILNKYRISNGKENIGRGWIPWSLEQVTVIVLTDGDSSLKNPLLSMWDEKVAQSDLYTSHMRWDYRILTYVLDGTGRLRESYKGTELYRLSVESGGDFTVCSGLKHILNEIKDLPSRLVFMQNRPFVTVDLAISGSTSIEEGEPVSSIDSPAPSSMAVGALFVSQGGEWPLPEGQWLDKQVETLKRRPSRPCLEVMVRQEGSTKSVAFSTDQLQYMVGIARSVGLHIDTYDINVISVNGDSLRVPLHGRPAKGSKGKANAAAVAAGLLPLNGCTPAEGLPIEDITPRSMAITNGCLGSSWCGVRLAGSDLKETAQPPIFGILCPSTQDPKQKSELLVLPYNFPVLLPLLQQAKDITQHSRSNFSVAASVQQCFPQAWQTSMASYLKGIPSYYLPSLYRIFKPLNLHVFISLLTNAATATQPSPDISLSRTNLKMLNRLAQRAKVELEHIDPSGGTNGPGLSIIGLSEGGLPIAGGVVPGLEAPVVSTEFCVTKSQALLTSSRYPFAGSNIGKGGASLSIPSLCGAPPATQDLLYTWERIRCFLYGGSGHTVRGVHVAGLPGSSSGASVDKDQQHDQDWFFRACGGAQVPRLAISGMSDYFSVLLRSEGVRDPELLAPPIDEDLPQGVMKRKLNINFGSPFKLSRRDKSGQSAGKQNGQNSMEEGVPTISADEGGMFTLADGAPTIDGLVDNSLLMLSTPSLVISPASNSPATPVSTFSIPTLQLKRRAPSPHEQIPPRQSAVHLPSFLSQFSEFNQAEEGGGTHRNGITQFASTDGFEDDRHEFTGDGYGNGHFPEAGGPSKFRRIESFPESLDEKLFPSINTDTNVSRLDGYDELSSQRYGDGSSDRQETNAASIQSQSTSAIAPVVPTSQSDAVVVGLPWSAVEVVKTEGRSTSPHATTTVTATSPNGGSLMVVGGNGDAHAPTVERVNGEGPAGSNTGVLPEGWIKRFSEKRQCDYWFNTLNGTSQWFPPS